MCNSKDHVKKYLANNGYPLEMLVAKEFRRAGFQVYQSTIYVDKATGKDRELDVTAYYVRRLGDVTISFQVNIECKFAKNIWILFSGEHEGFENLQIDNFYYGNFAATQMLNRLSIADGFAEKTWFKINTKFGYGLTETSSSAESQEGRTTYKAIATLLNSLHHAKERDSNSHGKFFNVVIPVIVFQGKMFECFLNNNNEEEVNEITEGQLLYKSNVVPNVFPLIEIITKEKTFELAEKLKKDFENILNNYQEELQPLFDSYPEDPNRYIHLSNDDII